MKSGKQTMIDVFVKNSPVEDQELWFETTEWAQSMAKVFDRNKATVDSVLSITETYQKGYHDLADLYVKLTLCPWWKFKKRDAIHKQIITMILSKETHNKLMSQFEQIEKDNKS